MWWLTDSPKLERMHCARIQRAETIYVSAGSYWEIAIKYKAGKPPEGHHYLLSSSDLAKAGFSLLPIDADDARRAGLLEWDHRDPFDRVLVAQASNRSLELITDDGVILQWFGAKPRRRR